MARRYLAVLAALLLFAGIGYCDNITSAAIASLQYPADGFSTYSTNVELAYSATLNSTDQILIDQIKNKSLEAWMFTDHSGSMTDYSDPVSGVFGIISSQIRNENVTTGSERMLYQWDADFIQATIDLYISRIQANFSPSKRYHLILVGDGGEEYLNLSLQYPLYKSLNLTIHFLQFGPGPASWGMNYVLRNNQAKDEIIRAANQTGGGYRNYSSWYYTVVPSHTDEIKTEILKMINVADAQGGAPPPAAQNASCALILDGIAVQNKTATNSTLEKFNATNLAVGRHYWKVDCLGASTPTWHFDILATQAPSVLLQYPSDGFLTYSTSVDFEYVYQKGTMGENIEQCGFYLDGRLEADINSSSGQATGHLVQNIATGKHSWKVMCGGAVSPEWEFEMLIPSVPKVALLAPKDGFQTREQNINFSFVYANGTFSPEFAQCDYILDGNLEAYAQAQSLNATAFGIYGIPVGAHTWKVSCEGATSEEWNFEVLAPTPPKVALIAPEDNFVAMEPDLEFSYVYLSGSYAPKQGACELILDSIALGALEANDSVPNRLWEYGILPGDHNWSVICNRGGQYEAISEEWHFFYLPDPRLGDVNSSRKDQRLDWNAIRQEFNATVGSFGPGGGFKELVNVTAPNSSKVLRQYIIQIFESDDVTPMENLSFFIHKEGSQLRRMERTSEGGRFFFIPLEEGLYYYSVPGYGMKRNATTNVTMEFVDGLGFDEIEEGARKHWVACFSICGLLLLLLILLIIARREMKRRRKRNKKKKSGSA